LLDPRISKQAEIIVDYSLNLKPGEEVVINASVEAIPLVRELVRKIVEKEAYPLLIRLDEESITEAFYKYAPQNVLTHVSIIEKEIVEKASASISIISPSHTKPLANVDPEKIKTRAQARKELNKIFLERSAKGELKWVVTIYPTKALAQEAGMSISEYEDLAT
jgi:aminopeptidase